MGDHLVAKVVQGFSDSSMMKESYVLWSSFD